MKVHYKHAMLEITIIIVIVTLAITLKMIDTFPLDAQINNEGTLVLWRINNAIPNEEMEISIDNGAVTWTYKVKTGSTSALKAHPYNSDTYYFDFNRRLPVNLTENGIALMCVRPWTEYNSKFQFRHSCNETFVTKNMARGILDYYFRLDTIEPKAAFMHY